MIVLAGKDALSFVEGSGACRNRPAPRREAVTGEVAVIRAPACAPVWAGTDPDSVIPR